MKKIAVGLLFSIILFAQETPTFEFKVGGFLVSEQNTNVQVGKSGAGLAVNVQDLFNMKSTNEVFRVDGTYHINEKHHVGFSWYSIKSTSSSARDISFEWDDKSIVAGGSLSTYFNTDIYKLNYYYTVFKEKEVEINLRTGIHATRFDVGFSGNYSVDGVASPSGKESASFTAPLPVFGINLKYFFTPDFSIDYTSDFFFITIDDVSGSMTDTTLSLDYKITENFGAGLGINSTQMKVNSDGEDNKYIKASHNVTGGLVYLSVSY